MSVEKIHPRHYFAYATLLQHLQLWGIASRIAEKFASWQFKFTLPHLSPHWLSLIRHSLVYYLLKNLGWTLVELQANWIILHSHAMKQQYTQIVLGHEEDFDFKFVILVKTITVFIARHIHEIMVDVTLENDIYQLIIHNLLGMPVQAFAYLALLKNYVNTITPKKEKQSRELQMTANSSISSSNKLKPLQLVSRRHGKRQSVDKIMEAIEKPLNLQQMKSALKENLYVKPMTRPHTPKYKINEFRMLQSSLKDEKVLQDRHFVNLSSVDKDLKKPKKVFLSNQLSNAFEFNSSLELKDVKKFPIQRSLAKLQPLGQSFYQMMKSNERKVELNRQDSKIKVQSKSGVKPLKNWDIILTNMKNQLYTGKHKIIVRKEKQTHNYDQQIGHITEKVSQTLNKSTAQLPNPSIPNEEFVKFRKLNLSNSPYVIIVEQKQENDRQFQIGHFVTKAASLFHPKQQRRTELLQKHKKNKTGISCRYPLGNQAQKL